MKAMRKYRIQGAHMNPDEITTFASDHGAHYRIAGVADLLIHVRLQRPRACTKGESHHPSGAEPASLVRPLERRREVEKVEWDGLEQQHAGIRNREGHLERACTNVGANFEEYTTAHMLPAAFVPKSYKVGTLVPAMMATHLIRDELVVTHDAHA